MTRREAQLIDAAIEYSKGRLTPDQFKACVCALQVERFGDAEEALCDQIVEIARKTEMASQRLHLIRIAIKRHDQFWQSEIGKKAEE